MKIEWVLFFVGLCGNWMNPFVSLCLARVKSDLSLAVSWLYLVPVMVSWWLPQRWFDLETGDKTSRLSMIIPGSRVTHVTRDICPLIHEGADNVTTHMSQANINSPTPGCFSCLRSRSYWVKDCAQEVAVNGLSQNIYIMTTPLQISQSARYR